MGRTGGRRGAYSAARAAERRDAGFLARSATLPVSAILPSLRTEAKSHLRTALLEWATRTTVTPSALARARMLSRTAASVLASRA